MSANEFSLDQKQSPVLLDAEKSAWIAGADREDSPVDIAGRRNERRKQGLKKTLICLENNRFNSARAVFTVMTFDTTTLRDSSPSVMIFEIREMTGCPEMKAQGYDGWESYTVDGIKITTGDIKYSVRERGDEIKNKREKMKEEREKEKTVEKHPGPGEDPEDEPEQGSEEVTPEDEIERELMEEKKEESGKNISASGLQIMLSCPLRYYYRYVCHLKDVQHMKPESHVWLGPAQKGTLCHRVMERYCKEVLPPAKELSPSVDESIFERIYSEELVKIEEEQPSPSKPVKENEESYYRELIKKYLLCLHKNWQDDEKNNKKWKVIGCELNFGQGYLNPDGEPLYYEGDYENESFTMPIDGSIDRLDGYLDGDKLNLRIVDYKTGKLAPKKEEVDLDVQIQHYMYAMAAIDYLKGDKGRKRLVEIFGTVPEKYGFESICYAFPYEDRPEEILETIDEVNKVSSGGDSITEMKVDFPDDVKRQIVRSIVRWHSGETEGISEYIKKEIADKIRKKYDHLYEEGVKEAKKKNPDADKPKYPVVFGHKEFCETNYCPYKGVCRKWIDVRALEEREGK